MTGWGREGPLAAVAGHDLTFLALSGALEAIGPEDGPPVPPLNLIGDMGGGGVFLAMGVLAALLERQKSGLGQVIDAAILDGVASQLTLILGLRRGGLWSGARGQNILDGGAPFFRNLSLPRRKICSGGRTRTKILRGTRRRAGARRGLARAVAVGPGALAALEQELSAIFATRPRDEWAALFEKTDACVAPVLSMAEAARHPHNAARSTFAGADPICSRRPRRNSPGRAPWLGGLPLQARMPGTS